MLLPTPRVEGFDAGGDGHLSLRAMAYRGLLPTPNARYRSGHATALGPEGQKQQRGLREVARAGLIPTPTVKGNYNRAGCSPTSGDGLATAMGGTLNPCFVEAIMGMPEGWTDVPLPVTAPPAKKPLATPSSRKPRKKRG